MLIVFCIRRALQPLHQLQAARALHIQLLGQCEVRPAVGFCQKIFMCSVGMDAGPGQSDCRAREARIR